MAIGIRMKRAKEGYDLTASKFFGAPTVPVEYECDFFDDEIFLCQIRLSDIAELDTEGRLPHEGYLYIFLYTGGGEYALKADVRYYDGEPEMVIDDFNSSVSGYEHLSEAYLMEFYPCDDLDSSTRLLGMPSDWGYEGEAPSLLLQFDPLDGDSGFLRHLDGYLYFFYGEGDEPSSVWLHEEYS